MFKGAAQTETKNEVHSEIQASLILDDIGIYWDILGYAGYVSMFVDCCLLFLHHEVWQSLGRPNTSANASASDWNED